MVAMDAYKEFKSVYKKNFVLNQDVSVIWKISEVEDAVAKAEPIKYAVAKACELLQRSLPRDLGHLKVLSMHAKLMKRNQGLGRKTSFVEFAAVLFLLHQYCVRILRSPWRTDYLTLKAYTGFYHYTVCEVMVASVSERLLSFIGFQYNDINDVFELGAVGLNKPLQRRLMEAGIDCFLSYVQCMTDADPHFRNRLQSSTARTPESQVSSTCPSYYSFDAPGASAVTSARARRENMQSSAAKSQDTVHYPPMQTAAASRGKLTNDRRFIKTSSARNSGISGPSVIPQDSPLDLSLEKNHRHTDGGDCSRQSAFGKRKPRPSRLEYSDDRSLYGGGDNPRHSSCENSINGHVLYPPRLLNSREGKHSLDAQMENCSCRDAENAPRAHLGAVHAANSNLSAGNNQYVKFMPASGSLRGSPDGEINEKTFGDHVKHPPGSEKHAGSTYTATWQPHIYHEIFDDDKLY